MSIFHVTYKKEDSVEYGVVSREYEDDYYDLVLTVLAPLCFLLQGVLVINLLNVA